MTRTDKEIRSILRNMLFYYYENIGSISKIGGCLITPSLIAKVTERYLELGGREDATLPNEHYEICWEERLSV